MKVEEDIIDVIRRRLSNKEEQEILMKLVISVSDVDLNVGPNQLIRCMLTLSDFDADEFQKILDSNFNGDPRDIIMEAHARNEKLNYGLDRFS